MKKKTMSKSIGMAVQRSVLIEDFRASIAKSPYSVDCIDKNSLVVYNTTGEKIADVVPFLRSVTLSIRTSIGNITTELYRSEFCKLPGLLMLVDVSVTANVFLSLFNDWSESAIYDKRHDCIRVCGYHIRANKQNDVVSCYVNIGDQCYVLHGVDSLAVHLASREFSLEPCVAVFAI